MASKSAKTTHIFCPPLNVMQQVIGAAVIAALPSTDHARWRTAALAAHD
jgi:hypothetical protein